MHVVQTALKMPSSHLTEAGRWSGVPAQGPNSCMPWRAMRDGEKGTESIRSLEKVSLFPPVVWHVYILKGKGKRRDFPNIVWVMLGSIRPCTCDLLCAMWDLFFHAWCLRDKLNSRKMCGYRQRYTECPELKSMASLKCQSNSALRGINSGLFRIVRRVRSHD
jgi:hypothetical protein